MCDRKTSSFDFCLHMLQCVCVCMVLSCLAAASRTVFVVYSDLCCMSGALNLLLLLQSLTLHFAHICCGAMQWQRPVPSPGEFPALPPHHQLTTQMFKRSSEERQKYSIEQIWTRGRKPAAEGVMP